MPWLATPAANPRAAKSRMPSAFISGVTISAPRMPDSTTSTAVSAGIPPMASDRAMAMGAVVDFGASEAITVSGAPSAQPTATAVPMAVIDPATSAAHIGRRLRRTAARLRQSGTASATVAGPSRKCTNCAPSK